MVWLLPPLLFASLARVFPPDEEVVGPTEAVEPLDRVLPPDDDVLLLAPVVLVLELLPLPLRLALPELSELLVLGPLERVLPPDELPPTVFQDEPVLAWPMLWSPLLALLLLSLLELPPVLPVLLDVTAPVVVVAFWVVWAELSKLGAMVLPLWSLALETPDWELVVLVLVAVLAVSLCPASCTLMVQFVAPVGQDGGVGLV